MLTDWMGWSLDFTGPQMVLTIKMTTLAINYFDGNEPAQAKQVIIDAMIQPQAPELFIYFFTQKMRPFQKEHLIEKLPSLLEFYGFVYFFPSFLAGPAVEIRDYLRFVEGTLVPKEDNVRYNNNRSLCILEANTTHTPRNMFPGCPC